MTSRPNEAAATEDFEFAALSEAANYRATLLREFAPHLRGHVLEAGSGIGQVTQLLRELPGVQLLAALEPDARFCARLRSSLPGQRLIRGTVEALSPDFPWDAILSINVLEHIEADARELGLYHDRLAGRHGVLCLFVPARPEIYAPVDRDFGHFRRYTLPELRSKLEGAGFDLLRLDYFNCVGYLAWWLNFCLLRKRHFEAAKVRFFDRVIFPVVHAFESRIVRPPIGQSLIAAARAR
jgi:SAM-dependent methyltransferase